MRTAQVRSAAAKNGVHNGLRSDELDPSLASGTPESSLRSDRVLQCASLVGHGDDGSASLTVIAFRFAKSDQRRGRHDVATDRRRTTRH